MKPNKNYIERFGDDEPILASGTRTPDKRRVSLRWLSGTFMTGVTSISLTGVALFVAFEGKEQLTLPAAAVASTIIEEQYSEGRLAKSDKQSRLRASLITDREPDKLVMEVSTLVKEGDQQIVQKRPFAFVSMPLATNFNLTTDYPDFNPLDIFANEAKSTNSTLASSEIYGASIDSEISLRTLSFPLKETGYSYAASMSLEEVEESVRTNGAILIGIDSQIAALHYVDSRRFGDQPTAIIDYTEKATARVVAENISIASFDGETENQKEFFEDIRSIRTTAKLADVMLDAGYENDQINIYASVLSRELDIENLQPGTSLRISVEQDEISSEIVRLSIYDQNIHQATAAKNDLGRYIIAQEPEYTPGIAALLEDTPTQLVPTSNLPTVYDAIYQAGISYGMTQDMVKQLVQMMAAKVDFKAKIQPTDTIEAFFSVDSDTAYADDTSELLYISARFGDRLSRFYKFTHPEDGTVDFYNEEGKSGRQFLLRNPTPTAIFRSGFGMRRHPITGRRRMHAGVDWAAPRGTPILSSGDGIVLEAGWHSGGYGRQTKIQHANGYVSSYSHQTSISKGVVPGARVRQGQVIGRIGSTGLSTGPHLHYELIVNGTKVDPLRVRLPDGKTLAGAALDQFHRERRKLNSLLDIDEASTELASN